MLRYWLVYVGVTLAVLAPWVGLIIVVVLQGHLNHRVSALEEKMEALTGELGWKKE